MAQQLKFVLDTVDVDKLELQEDVELIGLATIYLDGSAVCLARVGRTLCMIEVKIKWK